MAIESLLDEPGEELVRYMDLGPPRSNPETIALTTHRLLAVRFNRVQKGILVDVGDWLWFRLGFLRSVEVTEIKPGEARLHFWFQGKSFSFVGKGPGLLELFREVETANAAAVSQGTRVAEKVESTSAYELPADALERLIRLEGRGKANSRPFEVPTDVTVWRLRWSCGGEDESPLIYVQTLTGDQLGSVGGSGLQDGESYFFECGRFYLDVNIEAAWRADVEVIERGGVAAQS